MALFFGTSHQGTDHYTSAQAAELNASLIGPGVYLLERGEGFAASIVDANTVRIASGEIMVNGRHLGVEGHHDVILENGAPGVNRIALVALRIETGQQERAELVVYQGTPTAGEPVAPECAGGSLWEGAGVAEIAVCTVRIEGIVPQDPVMLLPGVVPSRVSLMESVKEELEGKSPVGHVHGTAGLENGSVTADKLAANSVVASKIKDGEVGSAKLAGASVTNAKIADSAVGTSKVADKAVTLAKLADNSVNAAKIVDGSVGTAELANSAVTNTKIAASTIAFDRLNAAAQKRVTDLEAFRDSVCYRLWSGTLNAGSSVTITGLRNSRVIGLVLANMPQGVMIYLVNKSGNNESGICIIPEGSGWNQQQFSAKVNISGNILKLVAGYEAVWSTSGLSSCPVLTGGENRALKEVYRIV